MELIAWTKTKPNTHQICNMAKIWRGQEWYLLAYSLDNGHQILKHKPTTLQPLSFLVYLKHHLANEMKWQKEAVFSSLVWDLVDSGKLSYEQFIWFVDFFFKSCYESYFNIFCNKMINFWRQKFKAFQTQYLIASLASLPLPKSNISQTW